MVKPNPNGYIAIGLAALVAAALVNWMTHKFFAFPVLWCWGGPLITALGFPYWLQLAFAAMVFYMAFALFMRGIKGVIMPSILLAVLSVLPAWGQTIFSHNSQCVASLPWEKPEVAKLPNKAPAKSIPETDLAKRLGIDPLERYSEAEAAEYLGMQRVDLAKLRREGKVAFISDSKRPLYSGEQVVYLYRTLGGS